MIEAQLRETLERLTGAIDSGDAAVIRSSLADIESTVAAHKSEIDAQLRHYLRNRSYLKALMYIKGESDIPKGRCGGRSDFS